VGLRQKKTVPSFKKKNTALGNSLGALKGEARDGPDSRKIGVIHLVRKKTRLHVAGREQRKEVRWKAALISSRNETPLMGKEGSGPSLGGERKEQEYNFKGSPEKGRKEGFGEEKDRDFLRDLHKSNKVTNRALERPYIKEESRN